MADARLEELKLLRVVGIKIINNLRKELIKQGHHLTGALEDSVHGTVVNTGKESHLIGTMAFYGGILNAGVSAERVPFKEGSGAGHSKYIDGLISYFKLRGLDDKNAKSAAFATAKKHKKEGMPTANSAIYSKNGQRTLFVQAVDNALSPEIDRMVTDGIDAIIDRKFRETKSETI